jgi:hypothetical protein
MKVGILSVGIISVDILEFDEKNVASKNDENYNIDPPGEDSVLAANYGRLSKEIWNSTHLLPFFGTDYGLCSLIKPQITFNWTLDTVRTLHFHSEAISIARLLNKNYFSTM